MTTYLVLDISPAPYAILRRQHDQRFMFFGILLGMEASDGLLVRHPPHLLVGGHRLGEVGWWVVTVMGWLVVVTVMGWLVPTTICSMTSQTMVGSTPTNNVPTIP